MQLLNKKNIFMSVTNKQLHQDNSDLLEYLLSYVTENKRKRIEEVMDFRTRHLTVVMEDIYQAQNASAVIRSCDCFGIQDIYTIENKNAYYYSKDVTKGSCKWVDLHRFNEENSNNTLNCINELKKKGYRIIATSPHGNSISLMDLPIERKMALVFGTEKYGVSDLVKEHADEFMHVPMHGFTESFNISVCVALCLQELSNRIKKSKVEWKLSSKEKQYLRYNWVKKIIKRSDLLELEYFENKL